MTSELWTFDDLVAASGGAADGRPSGPITGFSIDTRTIVAGDVFVALRDQRDGHEFVGKSFSGGAAAALVADGYQRKPGEGALIRVDDTLRALERIGGAARQRLSPEARVIAVTGSVGKTGTKEMLRACLSPIAATHAADKSFNNHWGVPLTLARMPAATRFGVFEIGMNHPGEITPLVGMVRPHVAIVTTVEPVHLAYFDSVQGIAEAKAEIFTGLLPGGTAIINRDNAYFDLLQRRAHDQGARIVSFGVHPDATVRPQHMSIEEDRTALEVSLESRSIAYSIGAPGAHLAQNSLAVVAALWAVGVDVAQAVPALKGVAAPVGRGARMEMQVAGGRLLLIDESYNANPASMRSALAAMGTVPREKYPRRIAVLGDMLELGEDAPRLHAELKEAVDAAGADLVFASGPNMAHLFQVMAQSRRGAWAASPEELGQMLTEQVGAGDVVMIKGSLGSRMAAVVDALKAKWANAQPK